MNITNKVFMFSADGGHAWLSVKRQLLIDLKIAHKITPYSYQRGQSVYLEEDQDATTFCEAFALKYGSKPKMREGKHYAHNPIRNYESYKINQTEAVLSIFEIIKVSI